MLPAAQRLRRRGDFTAVVRGGRRAGRGSVVVHVLTKASAPGGAAYGNSTDQEPARAGSQPLPTRAGFVVSKAVGGAVQRNLVKRRLRALAADRLAGLPAGTDLVVRAQPGAAARGYHELAVDLDAALAAGLARTNQGKRGTGV